MKNNNSGNSRNTALRRGKVSSIGLFESIPLMVSGYLDGKRSLPRENGDVWMSPHIEKEIRSYDEFASRVFGQLQLDEENDYARLEELINSVTDSGEQLEKAEEELHKAQMSESTVENCRMNGESRLTDAQVRARRIRESEKRLSVPVNKVNTLKEKLIKEAEEFQRLRSKIIEENNSSRMVCNRVRDRLYQRLAVYWGWALRSHPEGADMPAVPVFDVSIKAEDIYMKPHIKLLMEKAEILNEKIEKENAK